jgi:protein-tyrosine phosphatase
MIDIHCHILPGVDDGPADIGTSMMMLRTAAEDGITHIVATPHFVCEGTGSVADIQSRLAELRERVGEEGTPLMLHAGADIRLSPGLIERIGKRDIPTINGSRYFLLELPEIIPPNIERFFFDAGLKSLVPIITHPERNSGLLSRPERITSLREAGALYQLTAMSITGEFGDDVQRFSRLLVKRGAVDFVATDAHDPVWRKPNLSRAHGSVIRMSGEREARRIFLENPSAVLEDRPLP